MKTEQNKNKYKYKNKTKNRTEQKTNSSRKLTQKEKQKTKQKSDFDLMTFLNIFILFNNQVVKVLAFIVRKKYY